MQYQLASPFSLATEDVVSQREGNSFFFPSQRPIRSKSFCTTSMIVQFRSLDSQSDRWLNNSPKASLDVRNKEKTNIFSKQTSNQEQIQGQNDLLPYLYQKRARDNIYQYSPLSQINSFERGARLIDFTKGQIPVQSIENSKFPFIQKMLNNANSNKDGTPFAKRDSSKLETSVLDYSLSQINQAKINRAVAMGWISQDEEQRKNNERAKMVIYMQELSVQIEEKQKYKENRFRTEQTPSHELKRKQLINNHEIIRSPLDNSYLIRTGDRPSQKGYLQEYYNLSSSQNRSQIRDNSNPFSVNYQEHRFGSNDHSGRNDQLSLEKLIMAKRSTQDLQSSTQKQLEELKIEMELIRQQKMRAQEELETLQAKIRKQINSRNQNANSSEEEYLTQQFSGELDSSKQRSRNAAKNTNGLKTISPSYSFTGKNADFASRFKFQTKQLHNRQEFENNSLTPNKSQISKIPVINQEFLPNADPQDSLSSSTHTKDHHLNREIKQQEIEANEKLNINNEDTLIQDTILTEQKYQLQQNDSSNNEHFIENHDNENIVRSQHEGEAAQEVQILQHQQMSESLTSVLQNFEKGNQIKLNHSNSISTRNEEFDKTLENCLDNKPIQQDEKNDKSMRTSGNTSLSQYKGYPALESDEIKQTNSRVILKSNIAIKQIMQKKDTPQYILRQGILIQQKGVKASPREQYKDKHIKPQGLEQILENIEQMVSAQTRSLTRK